MKDKPLSEKEKLFCTYYSVNMNAVESAYKSGYTIAPERAAIKLLRRENVNEYISALVAKRKGSKDEVVAGLRRLAFGSISDAVRLAFEENIDTEALKDMELFGISEIKVSKGKSVEIKFFDRIKALEKLSGIITDDDEEAKSDIFRAIGEGADALRYRCDVNE